MLQVCFRALHGRMPSSVVFSQPARYELFTACRIITRWVMEAPASDLIFIGYAGQDI